jgi:hypothetical protein
MNTLQQRHPFAKRICWIVLSAMVLVPRLGWAHHEAIFGPQSSLVLSAPAFVSLQSYSRQLGSTGNRSQESNLLLSAGLSPIASIPLSLTLIAPASHISLPERGQTGAATSRRGFEDMILGARYRLDLAPLQERFGKEGNFLLGMAALEIPTGNVDHPAFDGPLDSMAALMGSMEVGPLSGIAYGFYRHHGTDGAGEQEGNNLFLGIGTAVTPWDDPNTLRLLSFQLGASYEIYFKDRSHGEPVPGSGGSGLYLHPTVVWGPGGNLLLFAMVTMPMVQDYADPSDRNRWRAGLGIVWMFDGHEG